MEGSFVINANNSHRYINNISDSIQLHFHFDIDLNSSERMSLLFRVFNNDTQTDYTEPIPGFSQNQYGYFKYFDESTDYILNLNFPFNYSLDFYKYDSLETAVVYCDYYSTSARTDQFLSTISVPMTDSANLSNLGGVLFTSLQFVLPLVAAYFAFRYIYNKVRKRFRGAGV